MIVPLKLKRDVVRPALGEFDKAVVKSGHVANWYRSWEHTRKDSRRQGLYCLSAHESLSTSQEVMANLWGLASQGLFCCGFSDSAMDLRNCSTADTAGARRQSLTTKRHTGDQ